MYTVFGPNAAIIERTAARAVNKKWTVWTKDDAVVVRPLFFFPSSILATLLRWHTKNYFVFIYIFRILSLRCFYLCNFSVVEFFFLLLSFAALAYFFSRCIIVSMEKKSLMKKITSKEKKNGQTEPKNKEAAKSMRWKRKPFAVWMRICAPFSKVKFCLECFWRAQAYAK